MKTRIYEMLPTYYVLIGIILELTLDSMLGRVSASLFIFAGVVVFNLRLSHRTAMLGWSDE